MRKTSDIAIERRRAIVAIVDTTPRKKSEIAAELKLGPHTLDHIIGWLSTHECIRTIGRGQWVSARLFSEMYPGIAKPKAPAAPAPQSIGWPNSGTKSVTHERIAGREVRVTRQGAPRGRYAPDPSIAGHGVVSQDWRERVGHEA